MNNPLIYTDPSGYVTKDALWAIWDLMGPRGGYWNGSMDKPHDFTESEARDALGGLGNNNGEWQQRGWSLNISGGGFNTGSHILGAKDIPRIWEKVHLSIKSNNDWFWVSDWSPPNLNITGLWGNSSSSAGFGGPKNSSPGGSGGPTNFGSNGLTIPEVVMHYNYGRRKPVDVPLNTVDLSKVKVSDFPVTRILNVDLGNKYRTNWTDAIVHGTITLELIPHTNLVTIHLDSDTMFNFDMKSWETETVRNLKTIALQLFVKRRVSYRHGGDFNINYIGEATIDW